MDKFDSMRLFVRVAQARGFASAAARAGLSTAAVSRVIMELESRLKARLVNRTQQQISLTEPGRRYLELIDESFDVAIVATTQLSDSSLVAQRLGTASSILCASADYLAKWGTPACIADLRRHRCLQLSLTDTSIAPLVFDEPETETFLPPRAARFAVNVPESMAEAIRAGMGIGALPVSAALAGLRDGTLRQVLPGSQLQPENIYAL